jgi:hypothetical protein
VRIQAQYDRSECFDRWGWVSPVKHSMAVRANEGKIIRVRAGATRYRERNDVMTLDVLSSMTTVRPSKFEPTDLARESAR